MPFKYGKGKKGASKNIAHEMRKHPERSRAQNIAIGLSEAGLTKKKGKKKK